MSFTDVAGHAHIIDILRRALESKRLAHAYLFSGPEGCGKRSVAIELIKAAYCGGTDGCGSCPSCRKLASLQHPDLHIIEPDGAFIKIDQIRELQRNLAFRPYEAPWKACIIESADRLHQAAGNSLLKTLEEPPGNALMILLTSNPDAVLPTIRSRCQTVRFSPLPEGVIAELLAAKGVDPATAHFAACLGGGSPGRAMELCSEETLAERRNLLEQIFSLSLQDIGRLFSTAEKLAGDKDRIPEILDLTATFLRDLLLFQTGSPDIVNSDMPELIAREAGKRSTDSVMRLVDEVNGIRRALQRNVNNRLAMDLLLMKLAA
jgi:DNA polymerase-3 subunit delta'